MQVDYRQNAPLNQEESPQSASTSTQTRRQCAFKTGPDGVMRHDLNQPAKRMRHLPALLTLLVALGIGWGTLNPPGPPGPPLPLTDKQLHALAFALLVLPLGWADIRHAVWLAPLALAYGGAIELVQPFVGRGAEWGDLLADGIGIGLGLAPGALRARLRV